jgi:murein DD-endopeptidase MepM/ murein hydrolase activator NlpD
LNDTQHDVLVRAAVPHTIIPDRTKEEIFTHVVQSGDTIFGVAAKFGLKPETIMWANSEVEGHPDWLRVGQELIVLPVDGVYHQVGGSDTIEGIAASYKAEPDAIINYPLNELDPDTPEIEVGQWLVVPDGKKPFVPRAVTAYSGPIPEDATVGLGAFGWPASGLISQGYWSGHQAIDIAAWIGAPVTAADSGHVVFSGWDDTGYGNTLVIDHGNGFQTLYAHLQAYYVNVGDNVAKGQHIAEMGSTGTSTGPHVHFELRQGTVQRNPIGFLP